jgi:hypothetical protein
LVCQDNLMIFFVCTSTHPPPIQNMKCFPHPSFMFLYNQCSILLGSQQSHFHHCRLNLPYLQLIKIEWHSVYTFVSDFSQYILEIHQYNYNSSLFLLLCCSIPLYKCIIIFVYSFTYWWTYRYCQFSVTMNSYA